MTTDIQLAFQGGGAKLVLLLAAAQAVRELEVKGDIKVRRVAGTSAGAIVGAFLAARCDIAKIKTSLAGPEGEKLLSAFAIPSFFAGAFKAWRGNRFWCDLALKDWLRSQFEHVADPLTKTFYFSDLVDKSMPELIVVATNLTTGQRYEPSGKSSVVEALVSSAGIPFCFRTWKTGGQEILVDGGLCKNLPVETLLSKRQQDGRVLAFSFTREAPPPIHNIKDFGYALLDVAINDSVQSAINAVGADSVCPMGSNAKELTTFSFEAAFQFLNSDRYDQEVARVRDWLIEKTKYKPARHVPVTDVWNLGSPEESFRTVKALGRIYSETHAKDRFKYKLMRVVIVANCLAKPGDAGWSKKDSVTYTLKFEPDQCPISTHKLVLSNPSDKNFTPDYAVTCWHEKDPEMRVEFVAAVTPENPKQRALLGFFLPPLAVGSGVCTLKLQDRGANLFAPLGAEGTDYAQFNVGRASGALQRVEIGMIVPVNFREVRLRKSDIGFQKMSEEEKHNLVDNVEEGFKLHAWVAHHVPQRELLRVDFDA